jgi:hypothetical protein
MEKLLNIHIKYKETARLAEAKEELTFRFVEIAKAMVLLKRWYN